MIEIDKAVVWGFEHAVRGMRNPLNSWSKSDSVVCLGGSADDGCSSNPNRDCPKRCGVVDGNSPFFCVGEKDYDLMAKLAKAGSDHGKFMRMIMVSCDITAPLYWWKEADTYKVGTVSNSCSTMHKIHAKEFTLDDFSHEYLAKAHCMNALRDIISNLNDARDIYNNYEKYQEEIESQGLSRKDAWYTMIQLLPSSYNQKRTITLNYEVLKNIYHARKNHKLDEWVNFCEWIETLPYSGLITGATE